MALSPNYSWAEPDNSSLVKNGAQDIRALGDAIDTSVWNVGFGQAGKNKMINGDFGIWQRGTSISLSSAGRVYTADRFNVQSNFSAGTSTFTQQTFTPGSAPVAGYEGSFFGRLTAGSTASYFDVGQKIEDVRTFAGQPVTISFWAKASASTPMSILLQQNFGSGGSASVDISSAITVTTSWVRYTYSTTLAALTGKTIGTGSHIGFYLLTTGAVTGSQTFDIWGVQLEYGSKATPFQTASETIQGELAMCQRYYYQNALGVNFFTTGAVYSGTSVRYSLPNPVTLRTTPTGLVTQNLTVSIPRTGGTVNTGTWAITYATPNTTTVTYTHGTSVLTAGDVAEAYGNNANSYIGWSAEL
jgi:hypothetical protein